ncbi:MAG: alpha/beta hydrolase [Verrucomicrobiales bacterium]|nr:alpha/beta hydrolase [Verrucomicrobiales bacterium]
MGWFLLLGIPLALWLFFRWFERVNVYQPSRSWAVTPDALGWRWQDVRFQTADGVELSGWFLPAPDGARHANLAVLVSHGNGGNISHRVSLYELLLDLGLNVFAYDYRGYGQSRGRPTEQGTYRDAEAALEWLQRHGFAKSQILAHGESLGGGIAAELALRHPDLRGLILRSTFTSLPDLGKELFPILPVGLVATIHYDTRSKLPAIRVPVLILHSRDDTLIPFHHAEANFAASTGAKRLAEIRGDHNDQPDASPALYADAIRDWLNLRRPQDSVP